MDAEEGSSSGESGDRAAPVIPYANLAVGPPASRLVFERLDGGGVRFTDPPKGWGGLMGARTFAWVGTLGIAGLVGWMIARVVALGLNDGIGNLAPAVMVACYCPFVWAQAKLWAGAATVIEVANGRIRLELPHLFDRRRSWSVARPPRIKVTMPIPALDVRRTVCSLMISPAPWRGAVTVLRNRDATEVRWVESELRSAITAARGEAVGRG